MSRGVVDERNGGLERLECRTVVTYNWGYEMAAAGLEYLYSKAVRSQWIATDALPWDTDVDAERPAYPEPIFPLFGTPFYDRLTEKERSTLRAEMMAWQVSQFLHGEQGALLAATQLCAAVPDLSSKFFAATQVADEARHVEVYDRYLHDKIGFKYPITTDLK